MEKSNRFQIIEGGAKAPSDWLDFPKVVIGRAVDDPNRVVAYRIATEDARAAASTGRRQKAFELWSAVIGIPPPVPNIARHLPLGGLTSFAKAHACFQGLKRPVADDKHGFDSFAFIIESGIIFTTTADMVCCAEPMMVPRDLLLAVYVRLDYPHGRPNGFNGNEPASVGIVTHWEFLERSPDDTSLPIDHAERYRRRRW